MTRVFISSTSKDLRDYRQAAIDVCLQLDLHPIGMEYFPAMGMGATAGSKRKLDAAGLYVGIFAHRYGYIEDGYNQSVTEIEFDYAGERGLDRLCFLLDPTHDWPDDSDHRETDSVKTAKMATFKARIDKAVIRAQFTDVNDFKARLMAALVTWQGKHPEGATTQQNVTTIYSTATGVLVEHPDDVPHLPEKLIGRDDLLAQTLAALATHESVLLLQGFGGIGKTALAAWIARGYLQNGDSPVLWLEAKNAEVRALLEGLARAVDESQVRAVAGQSPDGQRQAVRSLLRAAGVKLVVLDNAWNAGALKAALDAIPTGIPVLVTSRHRLPAAVRLEVGVLSRPASLELLRLHSKQPAGEGGNGADELCALLGDHAYAVEIAGKTLDVDGLTPADLVRRIQDTPHTLQMPENFAESGRESIAGLIEVSLTALRAQDETAYQAFLAFGAFFAPVVTPELLGMYFALPSESESGIGQSLRSSPVGEQKVTNIPDNTAEMLKQVAGDEFDLTEFFEMVMRPLQAESTSGDVKEGNPLPLREQDKANLIDNTAEILRQIADGELDLSKLVDMVMELLQAEIPLEVDTAPIEATLTLLARRGLADHRPATENTVASYQVHDLAHSYARAQQSATAQERALTACLMYTKKYKQPSLANFAALRPTLDTLMGAADWALENGNFQKTEDFAWGLNGAADGFLTLQG
ncbi:MAG: DUF4062 domain-containing protein [Anaerolineae bacterium]|nr:DUF4062 domain-containing protein [Anaerolineae bacterium]